MKRILRLVLYMRPYALFWAASAVPKHVKV